MASTLPPNPWRTLDNVPGRIVSVKKTPQNVSCPLVGSGISLAFIAMVGLGAGFFFGGTPTSFVVVATAIFGAYMAVNIGAIDVANNMGPAVGANVLTLGEAIVIAALCESAGAHLAGGDVVSTISKGIIDPGAVADSRIFIWAMMAAQISSALRVNLATWVGGLLGAGIAASGFSAVNWSSMGAIAANWMISPELGRVLTQ